MNKIRNKIYIIIVFVLAFGLCNVSAKESPTARYLHGAIYDPVNKQMLIFGGVNSLSSLSDTWAFGIESLQDNSAKASLKNTWEKIKIKKTPSARYYLSATYDPVNKQMLIFGGLGQAGFLSDTWAFDTEKNTWKEIDMEETPSVRGSYSAIYDPVNKQMLIFGGTGQTGESLSDTWAFDTEKNTWKEIDMEETPSARHGHSAIYDPVNKQMLIFGGTRQTGESLSDTWAFDIEKKTWEEIDTEETPPARYGHTAIYDPVNKQMLIFDGITEQVGFLSDIWAFDIEKKTWKEIDTEETPPARYFHSAIYDPVNKKMLIFAGRGSGQPGFLSDTWAFDIEKKSWKKVKLTK